METKNRTVKEFDTVKTFREIKTRISNDIKGMTFDQLQVYLDKNRLKPQNVAKLADDALVNPAPIST